MEPARYPFIWQCVGMIVGVYGIGYLAAAADPIRHWPIVLVGFLGKIFGPLGYVMGVADGTVPLAFGVTLPTNDLVWWVPFAAILWHAWQAHRRPVAAEPRESNGLTAAAKTPALSAGQVT
jgi:small multidrug resistance pump